MKKYLLKTAVLLVLSSCSVNNSPYSSYQKNLMGNSSSMQSSSVTSVSRSIANCASQQNEMQLYENWKETLKKAFKVSDIYSIGGACDMPDGSHWLSVIPSGHGEQGISAKIIHLSKENTPLKIIDGYYTSEGDFGACGFEAIEGKRLLMSCMDGVKDEYISINVETDERITLFTIQYGIPYGVTMQGAPIESYYCKKSMQGECKSKISRKVWEENLIKATGQAKIAVADSCDTNENKTFISYSYPSIGENYIANGVALLSATGSLIERTEDNSYSKINPLLFQCKTERAFIFYSKQGSLESPESHYQVFAGDLHSQKVYLMEAVHTSKNMNPCDSQGCIMFPTEKFSTFLYTNYP